MPESALNAANADAIIGRNFFLDLDNEKIMLSGVSGLDVELDVVEVNQNLKDGKQVHMKVLGGGLKAPDITLTRPAPEDAGSDPLWTWFKEIRDKGMKGSARESARKNGSVIIYDSSLVELGRFDFANAWPSKISTSDLSSDSNDVVTETITLSCEFIDRVK
jgi:phage tail-like protein